MASVGPRGDSGSFMARVENEVNGDSPFDKAEKRLKVDSSDVLANKPPTAALNQCVELVTSKQEERMESPTESEQQASNDCEETDEFSEKAESQLKDESQEKDDSEEKSELEERVQCKEIVEPEAEDDQDEEIHPHGNDQLDGKDRSEEKDVVEKDDPEDDSQEESELPPIRSPEESCRESHVALETKAASIDREKSRYDEDEAKVLTGALATGATESRGTVDTKDTPDEISKALERQVKKTCEACVRSKVKCDGNGPCERCQKRGVECQYLMEQKRGRRPGPLRRATPKVPKKREGQAVKKAKSTSTITPSPLIQPIESNVNPSGNPLTTKRKSTLNRIVASQVGILRRSNDLKVDSSIKTLESVDVRSQPVEMRAFGQMLTNMYADTASSFLSVLTPKEAGDVDPATLLLPWKAPAPSVNQFASTNPTSINNALSRLPNVFERRMFRVIFALYKHHHKNVSVFDSARTAWFEARFNKLWTIWRKKGTLQEQHRLTSWMFDNRVRLDPFLEQSATDPLRVKLGPNFGNLIDFRSSYPSQNAGLKLGTINIFSNFQVECDESIKRTLGYEAHDFVRPGGWCVNGFLPWGAEVVASIVSDDRQVLSYIRDVAVAFLIPRCESPGVVRVYFQRPMTIVHKNGMQVDTMCFVDVIESVTSDGLLLLGVSLHFFLVPPEQVQQSTTILDLGPWPTVITQASSIPAWLELLLQWVDSA